MHMYNLQYRFLAGGFFRIKGPARLFAYLSVTFCALFLQLTTLRYVQITSALCNLVLTGSDTHTRTTVRAAPFGRRKKKKETAKIDETRLKERKDSISCPLQSLGAFITRAFHGAGKQ